MTLQNLKQNIQEEKEIAEELLAFSNHLMVSGGKEQEMISQTVSRLREMLKIINKSLPLLLDNILPIKTLDGKEKEVKGLVNLVYEKGGKEKAVTIDEKDRRKFLEELRLLNFSVKKIKNEGKEKEVIFKQFKKPSEYAKISNKFFAGISNRLVEGGYFKNLSTDLRKSNMPFIVNTYVSMLLFTTLLVLIAAIILFGILIFFKMSIDFPFFVPADISFERLAWNLLICIAFPILVTVGFYFYPYTEMQTIGKRVNQELPFVVIHMSAIAGSGIEPTQIFKIIVMGQEYPYMKQEIRKVINQVNFFGYDLVSALKNSAKTAPSTALAELLNGLATTIYSGGSLGEFLDKRAETLLMDYKMEREKSTKMAESFMEIYISVVIAAPMIMMLLLILMSTGIMSIGLSLAAITIIIISIVALINMVFLVFLHLKQPTY